MALNSDEYFEDSLEQEPTEIELLKLRLSTIEAHLAEATGFSLAEYDSSYSEEAALSASPISLETGLPRRNVWMLPDGTYLDCRPNRITECNFELWEDGRWRSHTRIKDRSRHSKWNNSVSITFKYNTGHYVKNGRLRLWSGNISPQEEKTYDPKGWWQWGADNFDLLIRLDIDAFIELSCRRR